MDLKEKLGLPSSDDGLDLTQAIKQLSFPAPAEDGFDEEEGTALVLCRDSASKKWGPRWLSQAGLHPEVASDPAAGLAFARRTQPDVIVVEAALRDSDGNRLFEELLDAADLNIPVIVLCSNSRELSAALEADPFDVVRKPFEWQMISKRARYAARLSSAQSRLDESKASLEKALALADEAREQLRSRESFEPVTGLPNQTKFLDLLRRAMGTIDRNNSQLATIVVGFTVEQEDRFVDLVGVHER